MSVSVNDMIIDLFQVLPEIGDYERTKAVHVQRLIVPLNMAKGFAAAIMEAAASLERSIGITLLDTHEQVLPK